MSAIGVYGLSREEIGAGDHYEIGAGDHYEIGNMEIAIGAEETAQAVRQVIKKARDNRQPPPKMRAVAADAPEEEDLVSAWFSNIALDTSEFIGVANAFPLMTKLLTRFGAGQERPRYVRVDTEESYKGFLAENSPEMAQMKDHLSDLADKLDEHISDPNAHDDLIEAIEEAEMLGAKAQAAQQDKAIDMWLPDWAQGKVHAWEEGDFTCASIKLPGADGEIRICTSMTPTANAIEEMEQHASEANVNAAAVIGVIPAMGCVLGAGTLVKEMAAAAPSILQRPEASTSEPFMCRIEPKAAPSLCAFAALLVECSNGNQQARVEWNALADAAGKKAPYVAQAMREARDIFLKLKAGKNGKVLVGEQMKSPIKIAPIPKPGGGGQPLYRGDTVTIQGW